MVKINFCKCFHTILDSKQRKKIKSKKKSKVARHQAGKQIISKRLFQKYLIFYLELTFCKFYAYFRFNFHLKLIGIILFKVILSEKNFPNKSVMQEMNLQVEISNQMSHVGPWDDEQTIKYLIFLDQNKIVMTSKQKRKKFRVFDQMSDFISTRSSLQCRSHHQKAIQKYKQVRNIISFYKKQIGKDDFKFHSKQLKEKAKINQNYQVQMKSVAQQKQRVPTIQVQNKKQIPFPTVNVISSQYYPPVPINTFYSGFPVYTGVWPTNYFYFNSLI